VRNKLFTAAIAWTITISPVLAEVTSGPDNQPPPLVQAERVSKLSTLSIEEGDRVSKPTNLSPDEMDGVKGGFLDTCFNCNCSGSLLCYKTVS
jgi:hypothetical protein